MSHIAFDLLANTLSAIWRLLSLLHRILVDVDEPTCFDIHCQYRNCLGCDDLEGLGKGKELIAFFCISGIVHITLHNLPVLILGDCES